MPLSFSEHAKTFPPIYCTTCCAGMKGRPQSQTKISLGEPGTALLKEETSSRVIRPKFVESLQPEVVVNLTDIESFIDLVSAAC